MSRWLPHEFFLSILSAIRTWFEIWKFEIICKSFFLNILKVYGLAWEREISLRTITWFFRVRWPRWELRTSSRTGMRTWDEFDNYYMHFKSSGIGTRAWNSLEPLIKFTLRSNGDWYGFQPFPRLFVRKTVFAIRMYSRAYFSCFCFLKTFLVFFCQA